MLSRFFVCVFFMLSVIIIYLHSFTNSLMIAIILHQQMSLRRPINKPAYKYDSANHKKYRSVIFLTQRFGGPLIEQKSSTLAPQKSNVQYLTPKHDLPAQSDRIEYENMRMFGDMSIAQKIRVLRTPTYANNIKAVNKITNRFKLIPDSAITALQGSPHKITESQDSKLLYKSNADFHTQTQTSNVGQKTKKQKNNLKIVKKDSLPKNNKNLKIQTKVPIHHSLFAETQLETERCDEVDVEKLRKERCKTEMKEAVSRTNNQSARWESKSSLQWVKQDNKRDDAVAESTQTSKKTKGCKDKQAIIPKSCLYMSMYLRMRDKQEISEGIKAQGGMGQKKFMTINKIPNPAQTQCRPSQYFLKLKQSKSMFNNYSYYAVTSKLRSKKSTNEEVYRTTNDPVYVTLDKTKTYCDAHKQFAKSLNKKRYRKQSSKLSIGRGPTISIDPW